MDPIHPIVPVAPHIPPISPAPMIGKIDRDSARRSPDEDRRRRRQPTPTPPANDAEHGDDDTGLHVNVTA
jgi:hypothetical protein